MQALLAMLRPRTSTDPSRFLDTALKKVGPLSLCYVDAHWEIRKHIISLLQNHPTLTARADPFTYNDGSTAYLLKVNGVLPLKKLVRSPFPAEIQVDIWLHPRYPIDPPSVSLSLPPAAAAFAAVQAPLALAHPFVDSTTGAVTTPYLLKWGDASSSSFTPNLSQLTHNLIQIFTYWPPYTFITSPPTATPTAAAALLGQQSTREPITGDHNRHRDAVSHMTAAAAPVSQQDNYTRKTIGKSPTSSLASPREATDRLAMELLHDLSLLTVAVSEDVRGVVAAQARLKDRAAECALITSIYSKDLDQLRQEVQRVNARSDDFEEWLRGMDKSRFPEHAPEEAFLPVDDDDLKSNFTLEDSAGYLAIDDLLYRLEKALEAKVVKISPYLQQVRALATEQAAFIRRDAVNTLLPDGIPSRSSQQ